VLELNAALDHSLGGEISSRLAALYDYMLRRLLEANMQKTDAPLAEVSRLLSTLSEGWQQARVVADPGPVENAWPAPGETALAAGSQAWSV
jgi:flagellar protein FliS